MTDVPDETERDDDRHRRGVTAGSERRTYVAPKLVVYGTVAKLTQGGNGSFNDGGGMMMMMACL